MFGTPLALGATEWNPPRRSGHRATHDPTGVATATGSRDKEKIMHTSPHDRSVRERGLTAVELVIVVAIILIVASIAVARLARAKDTAEGGSAVGGLRAVAAAQTTARFTYGRYLAASDLADRGLLDATFRVMPRTRSGYVLTETGAGETIAYNADPTGLEHGARRYFMRAADGVIHWSDSGDPADADSPPLGAEDSE